MLKIYVGSKNPTKVDSVKRVFPEAEVVGMEVESKVAAQPFSDEETLEGAVNRARECASHINLKWASAWKAESWKSKMISTFATGARL